jgi:hypothetical protein
VLRFLLHSDLRSLLGCWFFGQVPETGLTHLSTSSCQISEDLRSLRSQFLREDADRLFITAASLLQSRETDFFLFSVIELAVQQCFLTA